MFRPMLHGTLFLISQAKILRGTKRDKLANQQYAATVANMQLFKDSLTKTAFPQCTIKCQTYRNCTGMDCDTECPVKFRCVKGKPWTLEPLTQTELDISSRGFTLRAST